MIGIMRISHYLSLVLVAGCATFPRPLPAVYGTVHVAFGVPLDAADPWRDDQIAQLRTELRSLAALGPEFVETSEGAADIVLRPFDSREADPEHTPCGSGVARFHIGSDYAEIDPTCAHGYGELRAAAGHEIGHFLGMGHICQHEEENASCVPGLRGDAVMNPSVSYQVDDSAEDPDGASAGIDVAQSKPTSLDIAEFRSVRAGRTHYAARRLSLRHAR